MTTELTKAVQQALEEWQRAKYAQPQQDPVIARAMQMIEEAFTQRPAAQEVDDGDVTGQPGPLPETGWDEVPEGAFRKPSPTAGMNLGERIKHVGGRENAAGYIEFGSVAAVRALVRQYLRDLPAPQQATPEPGDWRKRRMANLPHPHDAGMRVIGFVVPEDEAPLGLISERLEAIIGKQATPEPTVTFATVRDAEDELHIECRFSDGQKFAAVTVAQGFDNLAHRIETMLNGAQQATPEPVPRTVFIAGNETAMCAFASRELADRYVSNFGGATAGGMTVVEVPVVGATPEPVQTDSSEHLRVIASMGAALRRLSFAAQTSGGTAGPDAELQAAIGQAEQALSMGGIAQAMFATPEPVGEPVAWRWMPSHVFPTWVYSDDQNRVADARRFMGDGGVQALYAHPAPGVPEAWDEGYRQGVQDERTSEANIGIAGFGAKVSPARQNPYRAAAQAKGGEHA